MQHPGSPSGAGIRSLPFRVARLRSNATQSSFRVLLTLRPLRTGRNYPVPESDLFEGTPTLRLACPALGQSSRSPAKLEAHSLGVAPLVEGLGYVHPLEWNQPLVLTVKLFVMGENEVHELVSVDQAEITLGSCEGLRLVRERP